MMNPKRRVSLGYLIRGHNFLLNAHRPGYEGEALTKTLNHNFTRFVYVTLRSQKWIERLLVQGVAEQALKVTTMNQPLLLSVGCIIFRHIRIYIRRLIMPVKIVWSRGMTRSGMSQKKHGQTRAKLKSHFFEKARQGTTRRDLSRQSTLDWVKLGLARRYDLIRRGDTWALGCAWAANFENFDPSRHVTYQVSMAWANLFRPKACELGRKHDTTQSSSIHNHLYPSGGGLDKQDNGGWNLEETQGGNRNPELCV